MRSHEERIAEVKRRTAARERAKRLRRGRIAIVSAAAACLALIVGASLAMPGIVVRLQSGDHTGLETAASMYGGSTVLGYIMIGLLAFLLGVCVTILCFRIRRMEREEPQSEKSEERHGAD